MTKVGVARSTSLALLSGSGLFIEIALTRLFSVLYYPHYVYVILSLAVLGIGLGAGLAAWQGRLRQARLAPAYEALAGLATIALVLARYLGRLPARTGAACRAPGAALYHDWTGPGDAVQQRP